MRRVVNNAPFVPFSILFSRVIQLFDIVDLERLEDFVASLQPAANASGSGTHHYQLYELLCRAARVYITRNVGTETSDSILIGRNSIASQDLSLSQFEADIARGVGGSVGPGFDYYEPTALGDWYRGNQQLMSLLDEDITF